MFVNEISSKYVHVGTGEMFYFIRETWEGKKIEEAWIAGGTHDPAGRRFWGGRLHTGNPIDSQNFHIYIYTL